MTEESLFHEALSKPPAERTAFLDKACAGQLELRDAVESLLAAHDASGDLLDKPLDPLGETVDPTPGWDWDVAVGKGVHTPDSEEVSSAAAPTADYRPHMQPGLVIAGRYTLQEKIGEGGMGEVWVAKQTEPVKRRVALKVIKQGMDSKAVLGRFEQERQALAIMDHPNIAHVLDGGMTPTGQPFFVMELINGLPLTQFCDDATLTPQERLELFVPICQAVQHAHQKGIVHRDLKPSNILITIIDGRPVPKVIDFGVAKATGGNLTAEMMSTQFGAVVGTLEYMSPEQAGFSGVDVDTRADIYSLGVILYELLTGLRPIDAARLKKVALTEMIRIIQEEEPSRPSTRLSTDSSLPSLAVVRKMDPKKLTAMLRGELDWVVMKCLEKYRDRRYETANALVRDIQRYLANEPVEARPPSASYRFSKFLKRNKRSVLAAVAIVLLLLGGIAASTWQALRATKAEALAENRMIQAQEAYEQSEDRRKQAQEVSKFLISIFHKSDPWARRRMLTIEEMLEEAKARLPHAFQANSRIKADLLDALGQTFTVAGLQGDGAKLLQDAHTIRLREFGENDPRTIRSQAHLAFALYLKGDVDEGVRLSESALKRGRSLWKRDDPDSPIPEFLGNLALMYTAKGKPKQGLPLCREALDLSRAAKGPDHPDTAMAMWQLARAYNNTGKPQEALPRAKAAVDILTRKFGDSHPQCIAANNFYAMALGRSGQWERAVLLLEELYERNRKSLGPTNLRTLEYAISELSLGYLETRQYKKLINLLEPAVKQYADSRGPRHFVTINGLARLAIAHANIGEFSKALSLCHVTLKRANDKYGTNPQMMRTIGDLLIRSLPVEGVESLEFSRRNLQQIEELLGSDHLITFFANMNLALAYSQTDRHNEAESVMTKAVQRARRHLPDDHLWLQTALVWLATNQLRQKKHDGAERALRDLLVIREKTQPKSWRTFNTKSMLGAALLGQKKFAEAELQLLAGYEGIKKTISPKGKVRVSEALQRLIDFYEIRGKKGDAAKVAEWSVALAAFRGKSKRRPVIAPRP